ncbi:hypothetical protein M427DRAFT_67498 [Gonapodya prolifera JEL478]|uniref:Uncharacterized protein n=1 Tax=Gonapodya prolifera (strain JEL478) TaxID=1344416 RepID=A0A139AQX2_GONPJ|nr:hypothetical protein M427DRAFT_67498 [Gonapodya prolifera JEL478]|eukprot:KXS18895.1 hypothetical protein M427DRAFT_67498 [Gonapodya prolifera JEL478]
MTLRLSTSLSRAWTSATRASPGTLAMSFVCLPLHPRSFSLSTSRKQAGAGIGKAIAQGTAATAGGAATVGMGSTAGVIGGAVIAEKIGEKAIDKGIDVLGDKVKQVDFSKETKEMIDQIIGRVEENVPSVSEPQHDLADTLKTSKANIKKDVKQSLDDTKHQAQVAWDHAKDLSADGKEKVSSTVKHSEEKVSEAVTEARDRASDAAANAMVGTTGMAERARHAVNYVSDLGKKAVDRTKEMVGSGMESVGLKGASDAAFETGKKVADAVHSDAEKMLSGARSALSATATATAATSSDSINRLQGFVSSLEKDAKDSFERRYGISPQDAVDRARANTKAPADWADTLHAILQNTNTNTATANTDLGPQNQSPAVSGSGSEGTLVDQGDVEDVVQVGVDVERVTSTEGLLKQRGK